MIALKTIPEGIGKQSVRLSAWSQKAGRKPGPTFISTTEVTITANRKRNQTISIRLTPAEKKEIITKAKQTEMTLTDYLIECSRNTEIRVTDLTEVLVDKFQAFLLREIRFCYRRSAQNPRRDSQLDGR